MAAVPRIRKRLYTYQILLDLKVEPGLRDPHRAAPALLHRSHRLLSDRRSSPVPQLVADDVLLVFKSPEEGRAHVFRPGEPFAQVIVIPEEANFDLVEMGREEAAERELQARRITCEPGSAGGRIAVGLAHGNRFRRNLPFHCCAPPRRGTKATGSRCK